MSCRLLREVSQLPAVPLFEIGPVATAHSAAQPWTPREEVPQQSSSDEVARLRQRIRELEAAGDRDTQAARAAAFAEGEAIGREKAAAAAKPAMDKLAAAITEVSTLRARVRTEAERDLVTLSLAIARRILRREISVDPDAVQGLVRSALEKLQSRDITRVRVFPGHEEAVRRCLLSAHGASVELLADPALRAGDILVETTRGNLDASVETQLSEIERGFADRLR